MSTAGKLTNSNKKTCFWQKSLFFLLFLFFHSASFAQLNPSQQESLKLFLDGFVKERIQQGQLTGATAVLLYKDSVLLKEGYGWAELETRRPFSPDSTLFRLGSVTKIFTATAIMQLQEEGLLAINDPVSKYIDIPQASSFPEEITIKHLLTHSAGFGERYMNMASPSREKRLTLNEALNQYPVKRERKPGLVFGYSNYGYSLLGKIIERASGKSYEAYIKEKILDKLGMGSTLMEMPEDKKKVAKPYRPKAGRFVRLKPDYVNLPPAGSMLSTAADMSLFLSAHLNRRALLGEESFQLMQQRQFSNHPAIEGFGFSFFEVNKGGIEAYSHGGGWRGYNAYLLIIPSLKVGYFVATNTEHPAVFVDPLAKEFINYANQLLIEKPQAESKATASKDNTSVLTGLEGSYRHIRQPSDDLTSLFFELLIAEEKKVVLDGKAAIIEGEKFFLSKEGAMIPEADTGKRYALKLVENEPYLFSGIETFAKVQPTQLRPFLWLKFGLLLLLLILLAGQFWNKGSGASKFVTFASALLLLYLLVLFTYIGLRFEHVLFYGIDTFLSYWLWLPLLSILLFFIYLVTEGKDKKRALLLNLLSFWIVAFLLIDFNLLFEF